ncbi:hypothetical protein JBKA6_0044 [Ichthyobacterium seriolicida]|uniref:Uncharacterized protein n=1 Tax=Ichthyobacterium seriolicida TaxID=242600 RepID=A0A1J1DW19_9FLAO|nr:hypothetical protein JBKA6_0044 [Ichthyobacterium seriolicida]
MDSNTNIEVEIDEIEISKFMEIEKDYHESTLTLIKTRNTTRDSVEINVNASKKTILEMGGLILKDRSVVLPLQNVTSENSEEKHTIVSKAENGDRGSYMIFVKYKPLVSEKLSGKTFIIKRSDIVKFPSEKWMKEYNYDVEKFTKIHSIVNVISKYRFFFPDRIDYYHAEYENGVLLRGTKDENTKLAVWKDSKAKIWSKTFTHNNYDMRKIEISVLKKDDKTILRKKRILDIGEPEYEVHYIYEEDI